MISLLRTLSATAASVLVLGVAAAHAATIVSPVAVLNTVPEFFPGCCPIERTFDQSGLSSSFVSGTTDFDAYLATNPSHDDDFNLEWFAPSGTFSQDIDYDLGAVMSVDRVAFWNEESWGTTQVTIFGSNDPTFGTSTNLGTFNPPNNPLGSYLATVLNTTDITARYFRFSVAGTPGDDGDGSTLNQSVSIGEVAFSAASGGTTTGGGGGEVPEPASMVLLGSGLVLAAARRRIRAK